jgi:hypothetical protein
MPGVQRHVVRVRQAPHGDVALAELNSPVYGIAPLIVDPRTPHTGQRLRLAGWGSLSSTHPVPASHLQVGTVAITGRSDTTLAVAGRSPRSDTSACTYDSGAPYFHPLGRRTGLLVAVESHGPDCPHAGPETIARVDNLTHWIHRQIARGLAHPATAG